MSAHSLFPNLFPPPPPSSHPPAPAARTHDLVKGQHGGSVMEDDGGSVWSATTGTHLSSDGRGTTLSSQPTSVSSGGTRLTPSSSSSPPPSSSAPSPARAAAETDASQLVVRQSRPTAAGGSTFQSSSPPPRRSVTNTTTRGSSSSTAMRRQPSSTSEGHSSPDVGGGGSNFSQSPNFGDDSSDFILPQQQQSPHLVGGGGGAPAAQPPQIVQQMNAMAIATPPASVPSTPTQQKQQSPETIPQQQQAQPLESTPVAPPPPPAIKQKLTPLSSFEVCGTLGTGTFGRVLLVRVRSPSTPSSTPHPIFLPPTSSLSSSSSSSSSRSKSTLAENNNNNNNRPHYAMKILQKSEIVRLKQVEHINSERAILGRVRHPFIVELYETYQDSLNVYMLLSFIPGGELFSHLRRAGRFTPDVTRFYSSSIILAIAYLHSHDIIYRDLKPENLLLDQQGYLRLADFGFAKEVNDRTFTLCGTPEYLAPEIVLSKGHGKAVDWWALGILCFEMLAGYPPFFDDNPIGIYEKILSGKIAFPPHIDSYSKDLIRRLLTADRSKRLGNLRGGAMDVLMHPFYEFVDWRSLERREIAAPIIPHVTNPGDIQNFQHYPNPRPEDLPGLFGSRMNNPPPEESPAMRAHFEAF